MHTVNFTVKTVTITYSWLHVRYAQQLSISTELSKNHRHRRTTKSLASKYYNVTSTVKNY